jgi:cell division protein FtsI (penicillin-binding protein 3)
MGAAIIGKAAYIQMKEGKELRELAFNMHMKSQTIPAERGNIYTEDGQLLCSSIPQFNIHLDLSVVKPDTFKKYLDTLSRGISLILGTHTPGFYRNELNQAYDDSDHYYELQKKVPYDKYLALRSLPIFNKGQRRGGFIADVETKRINPYGFLGFRTIGLWRQNAQNVGLEGSFDSILSGTNGSRVVQKMTGGVYMPVEGSELDPVNGEDLVTTIDLNIQNVAEHAMLSVLQQYQCLYGTVIVMEVETGKIRGMVNLGRDEATGTYSEKQNYALTRAEPGSTFKLVTLLSLLNDGLVNVEDIVDCEGGAIRFGNRVMRDSHLGLGKMTIRDAYAHSSNAAMAKLAYQNYYKEPEKYIKHLQALGIDQKTGIDLKGERSPVLLKPGDKEWNSTTLPWLATGYGVLISPLRTCMLYNGVANNGKMMKPYLVSGVRAYGREIQHFEPTMLMQMGDSNVIRQLQACTREVVLSGTGKPIQSPNYGISGKTGTAQVADNIDGHWYPYSAGIYQGSFVGYFPNNKPKYTICVVLRTRPHAGAYYGGTLAAPVFRMISDKIFASGMGTWSGPLDSIAQVSRRNVVGGQATWSNYEQLVSSLGLSVNKDGMRNGAMTQISTDTSRHTAVKQNPVYRGLVPDVTGMGLRDALYLLESSGLQVEVHGTGFVRTQSIAPGTKAAKGQYIILQLSQA